MPQKYVLKTQRFEVLKMSAKSEYTKIKIYERKINFLFAIYTDFEGILVPQDNGKQNSG